MELHEAIVQRRTVRDFSPTPVPEDVTRRALGAGLKAPSHNHQKDWHFVLLTDRAAKLAYIKAEDRGENVSEKTLQNISQYEPLAQQMYREAIPKQNKMILEAPAVLVMVFKPDSHLFDSKTIADMNCLAAVWCCIQNILLSFAQDGVYGTTLVPHSTPAIKEALVIPKELEIAAIIPFGYKTPDAVIIPQKEVATEERMHTNKW